MNLWVSLFWVDSERKRVESRDQIDLAPSDGSRQYGARRVALLPHTHSLLQHAALPRSSEILEVGLGYLGDAGPSLRNCMLIMHSLRKLLEPTPELRTRTLLLAAEPGFRQ